MEINKKEIIDEIISLEPEFEDKREKLEKILNDIIDIKPSVKISADFKENLKSELLQKAHSNSNIFSNNKSNLLRFITTFLLWWATAFMVVWIFWINLNFVGVWEVENNQNINSMKNVESVSIQDDTIKDERIISKKRTVINEPKMWMMKMNIDSTSEDNSISDWVESDNLIEEKFVKNNNEIEELMMDNMAMGKSIDSRELVEEEKKSLFTELEKYLKKIGLNTEQIKEIFDIIKKNK